MTPKTDLIPRFNLLDQETFFAGLAHAIDKGISEYTLTECAALGIAVQCEGGIGGKVTQLTDEFVTFLRVQWSGYDLRTTPRFWHETHKRSALTNIRVATPVKPIRK